MLSALLFLAQAQGEINWVDPKIAYGQAASENKLVMRLDAVYSPEYVKDVEDFFKSEPVVAIAGQFVCFKAPRSGSDVTNDPHVHPGFSVSFLDKDGAPRGVAYVPMDPGLFVTWVQAIEAAWKKHDALVFRSKGRLNEQDSAKLAFSYAMRGETDRASAWLASIPAGHRVDEAEIAFMGLAVALADKRDFGGSIDSWLRLELLTRSPVFKSAARLGCGAAMFEDRPQEAWVKFKKVLNTSDSTPSDKHWAAIFLARLKARGVDGS